MPICGLNQKMLKGITSFHEGLLEQLQSRSANPDSVNEINQIINTLKEKIMALCGFNEKMLKGLTGFNEGLVEHGLRFRSEKNGETIDQGIKREISDMARLLPELHRIDDSGKRIITEGIIKYAQGYYLLVRKHGVEEATKLIENLGKYFHAMDEKYYGELEGKPDDMKSLAEFLDQFSL